MVDFDYEKFWNQKLAPLEQAVQNGLVLCVFCDTGRNHRVVHVFKTDVPDDEPEVAWSQDLWLYSALEKAAKSYLNNGETDAAPKCLGTASPTDRIDDWMLNGYCFSAKKVGQIIKASARVSSYLGEVTAFEGSTLREAYDGLNEMLRDEKHLAIANEWKRKGIPDDIDQE